MIKKMACFFIFKHLSENQLALVFFNSINRLCPSSCLWGKHCHSHFTSYKTRVQKSKQLVPSGNIKFYSWSLLQSVSSRIWLFHLPMSKQQRMGPCYLHRGPRCGSRRLALVWPSHGCCRHLENKQINR